MKRVVAIVLCDLACELARRRDPELARRPFAVIVGGGAGDGGAVIDAVDALAWRYGARPGQTAAEAAGFVGRLCIVQLPRDELLQALAAVAEMALSFAPTAALELDRPLPEPFVRYPAGSGAGPLDTVWLDVTGCAKLTGGDDLLCAELRKRVHDLGHAARVAIADGPRLAQAQARWGTAAEVVVRPGAVENARALGQLPVAALPLEEKTAAWLAKLGIWTAADLARLAREKLAHRLGPSAGDVLDLLAGRDGMPLRGHRAPRRVIERMSFEEGLVSSEPLLFVLGGMVARAALRLEARGEACTRAALRLRYDRSALALRSESDAEVREEELFDLRLPLPIARGDDLLRALRSRTERLELPAPVVEVALELDDLVKRQEAQLDIARHEGASPDALPTLLAELSAAVGPQNVGVLRIVDSHRPEARSQLVEPSLANAGMPRGRAPGPTGHRAARAILLAEPSRLLPQPIPIGRLRAGELIGAGQHFYLIDHLRLSIRLDDVEWWSEAPVCRDYARVQLHAADEHAEAWIFIDPRSPASGERRAFLHGWFE